MPGIAPEVISHKLSISPAYKPVRQKRRSYDAERYEAMRTEVDKLQTIGFIREATYPVWLANSVMVRKATCVAGKFGNGTKGQLSVATDRPACGRYCRPRTAKLHGRLFRIQSDIHAPFRQ
ncbi:hypothetical protein L3X38_037836 [Prunus dulcis]|uniref:Uncharacterized protein n=1 Tax=Prunus dulcis TaxID=3755 RepID=A0AAD4YRL4_PRUDU|nr:hypothetical protein L3X38_037836 [Prunus dulcis]